MNPCVLAGRRCRKRKVGVLLTLLLGLAALLPVGPAAAAEAPVLLALVVVAPSAPRPGDTLRVTVTATNDSGTAIPYFRLRLLVSRAPLLDRGSVDSYASGGAPNADGRAVAVTARGPGGQELPAASTLGAGGSVTITLEVPVASLRLGSAAAYPMAVEARGATTTGITRIALLRTFLPFVPTIKEFVPTSVAWLLPLTTQPARDAAGRFADDTLAESITRGGRLVRLLGLGDDTSKVTWAVDPALLEDLVVMSRPYQVRGPDGSLVPGTGTPGAVAWLSALRTVATQSDVTALPYGLPDVVALERHGRRGVLPAALEASQALAEDVLARPVPTDLAWPAGGHLDSATASTLAREGLTAVVVDGLDLPLAEQLPYTPTGRAVVGGMTALVADPVLSDLSALDTRALGSAALGMQRFLAETLTVTAERPGDGRTLLVAPPLLWNPAPEYAAALLALTTTVPWLTPASVQELRAQPDGPPRAPLSYPDDARTSELSRGYLSEVARTETTTGAVRSMLTDPEPVVGRFDAALLRTTSSGFRRSEPAGERLVAAVREDLATWTSGVSVVEGSATLPDSSASFPLTLVNDLDRDVTVSLTLTTGTPRLRLSAPGRIVIPAGRTVQVPVQAEAAVTGQVSATATLHAPNGEVIGAPATIVVRLTKIGRVALVLVVGASAVLFGAVVVRLARRFFRRSEDSA